MADINNPERLSVPLKDKDGYFYPITSYNQIVMPDGTFWNGEASGGTASVNGVTVDDNGNIEITASDVGARSDDWAPAISEIEGLQDAIDNAGKTKTVNNIAPDENGNIEITASDIGALTATDEIDAKTLDGMTLEQLKQAIMAEAVYQ